MIYIEKEELPDSVKEKIIGLSKSEEWGNIDEKETDKIRSFFDNYFPKTEVKEVLVREQKGLCAYCMRRIYRDSHCKIEHLVPLSRDKEKALDYHNLLGVCDGGEKSEKKYGRILCCDSHKKETEITITPYNSEQMKKIIYDSNGIISTNPRDEIMEKDINETLLLNGILKEDGTIRDTSTEIVKGRKDAYDRARKMMETLGRKNKCTSAVLKKIIVETKSKQPLEEYVGVKLYYFQRKYESLIKQGK